MNDAEVTAEEVAQWQALFPTGPVARLIAALRASQAEVERLEPLADMGQTVLDNAKPAEEVISSAQLFINILAERDAATAEVERLTREINDRDGIVARAFRVDL